MTPERLEVQALPLWERMVRGRKPLGVEFELTARCNNDCRHCYVNLPAGDGPARAAELTIDEVLAIGREAADLGAVWCLLTGGEPLLREDFAEIYVGLKRLGMLVSVFTNACLVTREHVELFRGHPPRDIEVSVYGATRETYQSVTRRPGSFDAFVRGLDLLLDSGVPVRFKAVAMRSTVHELEAIGRFCRERTKDYYRFDPQLHLRLDGDPRRNAEIRAERLSPGQVVAVECADAERLAALRRQNALGGPAEAADSAPAREARAEGRGDHLFRCGAGNGSFTVGHDGTFRLCNSLTHPDTVFDLRKGTLREAWETWVPHVRGLRGAGLGFLEKCSRCGIADLCLWCPAHAALENGSMDEWVGYFCDVAHARAAARAAGLAGA